MRMRCQRSSARLWPRHCNRAHTNRNVGSCGEGDQICRDADTENHRVKLQKGVDGRPQYEFDLGREVGKVLGKTFLADKDSDEKIARGHPSAVGAAGKDG